MNKDEIEFEIFTKKCKLSELDYKTSKYVDGDYSEAEWQTIVAERKNIRNEINNLEAMLNQEV